MYLNTFRWNLDRRDDWVLPYKLFNGDCLEMCETIPDERIDTIVTDPPYGLKFMGKGWDHGVPGVRFWQEFLRVCKPGAMLLAFGGTRTYHRLVCAIEDAGWEIRDCLAWLYGSGFPKSHDISKAIDKAAGIEREVVGHFKGTGVGSIAVENVKQEAQKRTKDSIDDYRQGWSITVPATPLAQLWDGWGTALKPAHEPICLAMKPLDGTFAQNAEKHGVAGLNIDGCRVGTTKQVPASGRTKLRDDGWGMKGDETTAGFDPNLGRWPANLIHDGSDEVLEVFPEAGGKVGMTQHGSGTNTRYGKFKQSDQSFVQDGIPDSGSAARFFYCAKASKSERGRMNKHPTVKPVALMRYLVRLTMTPTGGIVFDPFMGSGTTGVACMKEGRRFVGAENDEEYDYFQVAKKRIEKASKKKGLLI